MSYANVAGKTPLRKKEELSFALAHFSSPFSFTDLVSAVQRSAKISPIGVKSHPRGALLSFSTADRETALQREVWIGKSRIPLSPWPLLPTPPADRGKRWRLKGLPFHTSEKALRDALTSAGFPPTEVKLETVPNHPAVRTEYASFWLDLTLTPPKTIKIEEEPVLIFDPIRQPKPTPEKEKEKERERASPPPQNQPQPQPQPSAKLSPPATPTHQAALPAPSLVAGPTTPQQIPATSERSAKRRRTSPLSSPPRPTPESPLEEEAAPIDASFFEKIGVPFPTNHAILAIYEELKDDGEVKKIDQLVPTQSSVSKMTTINNPEDPSERYIITTLREDDPCNLLDLGGLYENSHDHHLLRLNWIQMTWFDRTLLVTIFKSRIARFRRSL